MNGKNILMIIYEKITYQENAVNIFHSIFFDIFKKSEMVRVKRNNISYIYIYHKKCDREV